MSHLVAREPWGTVDLDVARGHVFVRQDWQYQWKFQLLMRPWSDAERAAFHRAVDRQVWRTWSLHARLMVAAKKAGPSGDPGPVLARACGSRGLSVSFDVRQVKTAPHWRVNVLKLADGLDQRASVDLDAREITLYIEDTAPSPACNEGGAMAFKFMTIPHEFGHTLGADDEYERRSPYLADVASLMNIGSRLRARHFRLLCHTLERLVPGTAFKAMV
jgi:hypothetical protein